MSPTDFIKIYIALSCLVAVVAFGYRCFTLKVLLLSTPTDAEVVKIISEPKQENFWLKHSANNYPVVVPIYLNNHTYKLGDHLTVWVSPLDDTVIFFSQPKKSTVILDGIKYGLGVLLILGMLLYFIYFKGIAKLNM